MQNFLIAVLLYLPTTFLVDAEVYLIFVPLIGFLKRDELVNFWVSFKESTFSKKNIRTIWLLLAILLLIAINLVLGHAPLKTIIKSPVIFTPLVVISAYMIANPKVIRFLLWIIAFEVIIGLAEFAFGVNTFFSFLPRHFEFINYDSLYHTRTFGLGFNSSNLAQKVFIGLILLCFGRLNLKRSHIIVLFTLMVAGIIISFGRTVLIASLLVFSVGIIIFLFKQLIKKSANQRERTIGVLCIAAIGVFLVFNSFFVNQFTRLGMIPRMLDDGMGGQFLGSFGLGNLEMAGRKELWSAAIEFIYANPLFGNHSTRFLVHGSHLHNSFLQFLSNHGVIIFLLMLAYILSNLKKNNFILIGFICLYSMGQFGIFWNISFLDVLFVSILLFSQQMFNIENEFDSE